MITVRYTKETAKSAPLEVEQNWINTDFINYNKDNSKVIESHKLLICKNKNIVDIDGLNPDYSKLLLNLNNENLEK